MPSLSSGVLEKLIEEMESDQKSLYGDHQKPVLLQIRNITPVLSEGDLWPSKGFYLKVSDAKHTMYVSLPPEQDDMVLCDTLQLGQLIYVEKLEEAWPVPVLRGINPVTGRLPCVGQHEDLFSIDKFVDFKGVSDLLFVMEKSSGVEKKLRPKFRSLRASKIHPIEKITSVCRNGSGDIIEKEICEVPKGSRKVKSRYAESDSESTISSSSLRRRSWTGPEAADFPLVKRGVKPSARRSRSAHVSISIYVIYFSNEHCLIYSLNTQWWNDSKKLMNNYLTFRFRLASISLEQMNY